MTLNGESSAAGAANDGLIRAATASARDRNVDRNVRRTGIIFYTYFTTMDLKLIEIITIKQITLA